MTKPIKLPPLLPCVKSCGQKYEGYSSAEVLEYATAAIEADRQARGEPVAWFEQGASGEWFLVYSHNPNAVTVPLYTAPQPQQIPKGYKLVPIEPTEEMLEAGLKALLDGGGIYRAMLKATPEPKGKP